MNHYTDSQQAAIEQLMSITGAQSPEVCAEILTQHGWDIQAAVEYMFEPQPQSEDLAPQSHVQTAAVQPAGFSLDSIPGGRFVGAVAGFGWGAVSGTVNLVGRAVSWPFRALGGGQAVEHIEARVYSFNDEFEAKYGHIHPNFHEGSYDDAVADARRLFRPLVVYLHSPSHIDSDEFCSTCLTHEPLIALLDNDAVFWAGSVSHEGPFGLANIFGVSAYPFVAVLANAQSNVMQVIGRVEGTINMELLTKSVHELLQLATGLVSMAQNEAIGQQQDRQLIEDQNIAYQQSLAADQAREREAAEAAEQLRLVEEETKRKEEDERLRVELKAEKAQRKRESLPPEPSTAIVSLMVRLPGGRRIERKFRENDVIGLVMDWIESEDHDLVDSFGKTHVILSNFPRRTHSDATTTLSDAGLVPQAALFVEEID